MKSYYRILDLQKEVDKLYEVGIIKGVNVGFNCLNDLYSIKLGSTTYVMGSPYSGKTEFWLEILINLSEFYGWNHVIFTPETGSREEIIAELCSKYLKKPFYKYDNRMTENEKYKAMTWLNEHFFIIDPDTNITPEDFYKQVDNIENEFGIKIHTTTLDPYNELKNNIGENGRQDLYIEELLGYVRRNSRINKRHNCIITHAADQQAKEEKGIVYYPPPTPRQYAGGQAWFRKGLGMIAVWRPPFGLSDSNGEDYKENETHIIIQKVKPKGTGKRGVAKLYFNLNKNRFYEISITGMEVYAHKEQEVQQENNYKSFTEPATITEPENLPF